MVPPQHCPAWYSASCLDSNSCCNCKPENVPMQCSPFHLSQLHPQLSCLPSYYCWSTQNFFHNSLELGRILSQVNFNSPSLHNGQALGVNGATVSRFSVPKICRHQLHYPHREVLGPLLLHLKHLVFLPVEQPHQLHHFSSFLHEGSVLDGLSPAASAPIHFVVPLSAASSPGTISPIDLPSNVLQMAGSLLFSPAPREPAPDTCRLATRRVLKPLGMG